MGFKGGSSVVVVVAVVVVVPVVPVVLRGAHAGGPFPPASINPQSGFV